MPNDLNKKTISDFIKTVPETPFEDVKNEEHKRFSTPSDIDSKGAVESNYKTIGYADIILDEKLNSKFISTSPREDTVYEILQDPNGSIKLGVWKGAEKRVLNTPDFIDGTNKQTMSSNPTLLEVELGDLQKNDEGGYTLTKKPKILLVDEKYIKNKSNTKTKTEENIEIQSPQQSNLSEKENGDIDIPGTSETIIKPEEKNSEYESQKAEIEKYIKDRIIFTGTDGGFTTIDTSNIKNEGAGLDGDVRRSYSDYHYEVILDSDEHKKSLFQDLKYGGDSYSWHMIDNYMNKGKKYLIVGISNKAEPKLDDQRNGSLFASIEDTGKLPPNIKVFIEKALIDKYEEVRLRRPNIYGQLPNKFIDKFNTRYNLALAELDKKFGKENQPVEILVNNESTKEINNIEGSGWTDEKEKELQEMIRKHKETEIEIAKLFEMIKQLPDDEEENDETIELKDNEENIHGGFDKSIEKLEEYIINKEPWEIQPGQRSVNTKDPRYIENLINSYDQITNMDANERITTCGETGGWAWRRVGDINMDSSLKEYIKDGIKKGLVLKGALPYEKQPFIVEQTKEDIENANAEGRYEKSIKAKEMTLEKALHILNRYGIEPSEEMQKIKKEIRNVREGESIIGKLFDNQGDLRQEGMFAVDEPEITGSLPLIKSGFEHELTDESDDRNGQKWKIGETIILDGKIDRIIGIEKNGNVRSEHYAYLLNKNEGSIDRRPTNTIIFEKFNNKFILINSIKRCLEKGYYERWVKEGRMKVSDVKRIIESAGLTYQENIGQ